jgi:hypothetical protein
VRDTEALGKRPEATRKPEQLLRAWGARALGDHTSSNLAALAPGGRRKGGTA